MKKKIYAILLGVLSLTSCGKFLEEYSQDLYYAHKWEDLDELLVGSGYLEHTVSAPLTSSPGDFGQFLLMITDDIEEVQKTNYTSEEFDVQQYVFGAYTWQQRIGTTDTYTSYLAENGTWTKAYYHINVCNNILSSLERLTPENQEDEQGHHKVKGEAHFIRAFLYFFLNNLYGKPYVAATAKTDLGVPIKLSENVEDKKFTRNTVQEVYDLVLSDLEVARTELEAYKGEKKSIYRADYTAALLLSARVALYMQNWADASKYASMVMEKHPELEDLNTTSNVFDRAGNPEDIFTMGPNDNYSIYANAYKGYMLSKDLYDSYSSYDKRKTQWIWADADCACLCRVDPKEYWSTLYDRSEASFYYINVHSVYQGYRIGVGNICRLRSAEAYLIEAEAKAYMGKDSEAQSAINKLRAVRFATGYGNVNLTSTGDQLIADIRAERRRELISEGQRWFDLRRYMVCEKLPESHAITHDYTYYKDRGNVTKVETHRFILQPNDVAYTLGIPHEVLEFNTGMKDNERYYREYEIIPIEK